MYQALIDIKQMMGHVYAVYSRWPTITIDKRYPHDEENTQFLVCASMSFKGIMIQGQVVLEDLADTAAFRQALSNLTARLFQKAGEIALAAAAKSGGEK